MSDTGAEVMRRYALRHPERVKARARRHRAFKKARYNALLHEAGCCFCGEDDPVVLECHHLDPSQKTKAVCQLITYSDTVLEAEMSKCSVVCANCHRRLHAHDWRPPPKAKLSRMFGFK